ncbi:MAG TPA: XdhC family protein [Blastocatellia bacterium]|nr:XdhC family protein [Blastocatellia bacterium]
MAEPSNIRTAFGAPLSSAEIFREMYRRLDDGAKAAAMATVIKTKGSTPQQVGAKMVVFDDGSFIGTVGGGCVEADIYAICRETLETGAMDIHEFNLNDDYAQADGMVCGGTMFVLIERWVPEDERISTPPAS